MPTGYDGKYNGTRITFQDDNGQEIVGLEPETYNSYSDAASTQAPEPSQVVDGWDITPTAQTIDWTVGTDGTLAKTDYYYYVSPHEDNVSINYVSSDGYDLLSIIKANNLSPILSTTGTAGEAIENSGVLTIPGYDCVSYTYAGVSTPVNSLTPSPLPDIDYQANQNDLTFNYEPHAQEIPINYIYNRTDASSKNGPVPPADFNQTVATKVIGVTNGTTYTTDINTSAEPTTTAITIPTLVGYTANVTSANPLKPNFAINADGTLITPSLTVTYTANQNNVATMAYEDADGNDISKYASTPVSLNASGTTDQPFPTSGAVEIPGYTLKEIDFIPAVGSPLTGTTVDNLVFSGGGATTPDKVKFVYTANAQTVNVHYLYSGGGKNGLEIQGLTPGTLTLNGVSNAATTTMTAPDAPVGYDLVQAGLTTASPGVYTQPVMWTTVNGQLVTPDIYFYYQAQVTQATVNYTTSDGGSDLNGAVPTGTLTGVVNGLTDDKIPASGAVPIAGYNFSSLKVNGVEVTTKIADANAYVAPFSPNATVSGKTTIEYLYTPDTQTAIVKFVDAAGNPIMVGNGGAVPDVQLTGKTNESIDYSSITATYQGYDLETDGRTTTTTYDANDAVNQVIYLVYKPKAQKVSVVYKDENNNSLKPDTDLSGLSNGIIDYATIDASIPGYTLISDGRTSIARYDTNPLVDQTVVLQYKANQQQVVVNFKISRDGGQTWSDLAKPATLSGESKGLIDYSALQVDYSGYALINKTQQDATTTYDTADGVNQTVNLYYAPLKQVAILQTDATDPDTSGGQAVMTTTDGYSFGTLKFATNSEQNLARKGFTYKVYGPDGVWYDTLANALAANNSYDGTPTNAPITTTPPALRRLNLVTQSSIVKSVIPMTPGIDPSNPGPQAGDAAPQVFTASYTPMPESMVVQTVNDPAGNKVYPAATGVTGLDDQNTPIPNTSPLYKDGVQPLLSWVPNVSGFYNVNVVDTQLQTTTSGLPNLARHGYTYVVKAPDGTEYPTLQAATNAVHVFDNDPNSNQVFHVIYTAQLQTVNLMTDTSDPKGAQTIETAHGPSDSNISLNSDDSNLKRSGYTYQVTTPDGATYDTLVDALKNYPNYDNNTIPTDTGIDPTPQNIMVSYTPVKQTANLIVEGKIVETVTDDSDSKLTFKATDSDFHKSGYISKVTAPDGKVYNSLAEALKAVSTYDHNDLIDGKDETPQNFSLAYKPFQQTANLIVEGKIVETVTGDSDSKIDFKATDKELHKSGYTYRVMISNGDEYNSLAEALEAVSIYDHNDLIDDKDVTPQNFTVNYTPVKQTANLMVGGKLLETVTGDSDAKLTFKTTDTDLYRSGYTYKVTASNGQVYQSLEEALKAIATYDHNDLTNGKDMSPQNFTIVYTKTQTPTTPPAQGPEGHEFGTFGEKIEQYGLVGAILLTLLILTFIAKKLLKRKADK